MLWDNTAYCVKLSAEDLSSCSNKIESVSLRICTYYHYLTKKWCRSKRKFRRACPTSWRENSYHRYGV